MQVVILAGGTGTRLKEMTEFIPKAMIPIGGKPIIHHIMKLYSHYGFKDFVLALGYKQETIKNYFWNYNVINEDLILDGSPVRFKAVEDWKITLSDTGEKTMKGARLKRIEKYITGDTFMMTYGDGIGDVDIGRLLKFHESHGKMVTVTGVHPTPRFGEIAYQPTGIIGRSGQVTSFSEKPHDGETLINGGFFVFNRRIFDYLTEDEWCDLEAGPLELIAERRQMMVFAHHGFWGCMDTIRDMAALNQLWDTGQARWRVWDVR